MDKRCGPVKILEVTSYPPPRAGWGIRVEFLKKRLETDGHECVVLNIGSSRRIPSTEYETVMGGSDFLAKIWRYSRSGFRVHAHANGDALKGLMLALTAEIVARACRRPCYLTFHAGAIQRYFPQHRSRWHVPLFRMLFALPHRIICNSDAVKACISGYGIQPAKIVPIPAFSREYLDFTIVPLPESLERFVAQYRHVVFTYVRMRPLFYPVTLIEGMARVMEHHPDVGLIICGMAGHSDAGVRPSVDDAIRRFGIADRICMLDDLDHDAFLTVLTRSVLYLRTPITDGVASSVLEAIALGIPVVASDNGHRPSGVVTYSADDAQEMARAVEHVIADRARIVAGLGAVDLPDTLSAEVALLTC